VLALSTHLPLRRKKKKIAAALGRTLNRIARFDTGSNPSDSKESKVLNVTHNSVSNLLTFIGNVSEFRCGGIPSSKLSRQRRFVVDLFFVNIILEERERRGVILDLLLVKT